MKLVRCLQPNPGIHEDERGGIYPVPIAPDAIRSINYITGRAGAVRGLHVHKKDTHYCLVIGGRIQYSWTKKVGGPVESVILESGDMVFSDVGEAHKFEFLTDGIFLDFNTQARTKESYEKDLTRVSF